MKHFWVRMSRGVAPDIATWHALRKNDKVRWEIWCKTRPDTVNFSSAVRRGREQLSDERERREPPHELHAERARPDAQSQWHDTPSLRNERRPPTARTICWDGKRCESYTTRPRISGNRSGTEKTCSAKRTGRHFLPGGFPTASRNSIRARLCWKWAPSPSWKTAFDEATWILVSINATSVICELSG